MNALTRKSADRRLILHCCALALCALAATPAWAACPKLLMDGGVFIRKQTNAQQAAYWGQTVGVQGFLVHEVMRDWDTDVGTDTDSDLWKLVSQFQTIYSQHGVTDNFIRVGLFTVHDWHNTWQNEAAVKNFAHAAALAKHAGFKGMALDTEPYQPTWGGSQDLASTVQQEGRAIGQAMHDAYPEMTLIIENDALHHAFQRHNPLTAIANVQAMPPDSSMQHNGGYQLAVPFLRGLLSVDWSHVVIATEETYKDTNIDKVVQLTSKNYSAFLDDGAAWTNLSTAPGLWPLGLSKFDKSARETPEQFKELLQSGLQVAPQYVWIYAYGSAWQTDGPYGPGPVVPNFQQYTDAVHQACAACEAGVAPPPPPVEPRQRVTPTAPEDPAWQPFESGERNVPAVSTDPARPIRTLPRVVPLQLAHPWRGQVEVQ